MKKISMTLDDKSIDKAIKEVKAYRQSVSKKCDIVTRRIVQEILVPAIKANLSGIQYDGDALDITVTAKQISPGVWAAVASGENLLFAEFGTGVTYSDNHPKAAELGMVRGSYGQGKVKQAAWGYYGEPGTNGKIIKTTDKGNLVITHGNPANMPVYNAAKTLEQSTALIAKIVRDVFST